MNRFLKLFSIVTVLAIFLGGCSAQKGTGTSVGAWKGAVKGVWTLSSIQEENFPSGASVKTIFDEAPSDCFIASQWTLYGSGKGTITFVETGSACMPGSVREIHWSVVKDEFSQIAGFQFKKILPGDRAKDVTVGYRLELESAGEGRMTMRMPLDVGNNQIGYLIFKFVQI